jgi:hypothetical protein
MGKGKKAPDAKVEVFKRLYGVKPGTFEKMESILQTESPINRQKNQKEWYSGKGESVQQRACAESGGH